jgi:hypothetical protein
MPVSDVTRLKRWTWRPCRLALATLFSLLSVGFLDAQSTSISFTGPAYNQNFDTLPNSGVFSFTGSGPFDLPTTTPGSLNGWAFQRLSGTSANAAFRFGDGSTNNQGVYSYGTAGSAERALGTFAGGQLVSSIGSLYVNNSGSTIDTIRITFTGEQWRRGASPNTLSFQYSVGATSISSGVFTSFSALNFTGPQSGSSIALNGNLAANQVQVSATISGLNWTAGSRLVIRWNDSNDPGADSGLAIDNFSLSIPEPATVAAGIAALGLMAMALRAQKVRRLPE